jgi:pimeloyl-ACP methyl ester carboxylesterase
MSELVAICGTSNPKRRGDVVLVHGLNGDARATWQPDGQPGRFWPSWLCEDIPDIGVWSVGYEASSFGWNGSTMPLADRAVNALVMLDTHDIGKEKPVIFITHSLGGLLVKEMLRKATDGSVSEGAKLAQNTCGVVFLSTPHSGSDLANFVDFLKVLLPTDSVRELKPNEPRLRELNTWYRNNVGKLGIETQVYCERKPTKAGQGWFKGRFEAMVVDVNSSDPGIAGVIAVPMDDDHFTISRPERTSVLYLRIKRFVDERFRDFTNTSSKQAQTGSATTLPGTASLGNVVIGGNMEGGVIVTGSGNSINVPEPANTSGSQKSRVSSMAVDIPSLLDKLNRLVPTQLGTLILILQVPPNVMPGSGATHGERVNALIAWAQGLGGLGLEKVQEELEKLIRPR